MSENVTTLPASAFADVVAKVKADYDAAKRQRADYVAATDVDSAIQDILASLSLPDTVDKEMVKAGDPAHMLRAIENARKTIAQLEPKVNEWARDEAQKQNNADFDEPVARESYNDSQKAVKDQINSLVTIMETMGEFDDEGEPLTAGAALIREMESALPSRINKPGGGGSSSATVDTETAAIREWAKAKGMDVGEKGRIKAEIKDAYYAAKKQAEGTPAE